MVCKQCFVLRKVVILGGPVLGAALFVAGRAWLRRNATGVKYREAHADRPLPYAVHNGLAVFRFGKGDPLLFMPYPHALSVVGDPGPTEIFNRLAALGREVITFDPPASGQSTRPTRLGMPEMIDCANEALSVCGIEGPVDVMGHSQGGVAALAYALQRPERVRSLVVICASSGGPAFMRAPGAIWNRTHPDFWRFALLAMLYVLVPRRAPEMIMNNLIFRDSFVDSGFFTPVRVSWRDWISPPRPRARWGGKVARKIDYSGRLAEVRVPTLVIAGRSDPQMPPACAEELAEGIPGARLELFERSGHYPFVEEPEQFWHAVRLFLHRSARRKKPVVNIHSLLIRGEEPEEASHEELDRLRLSVR